MNKRAALGKKLLLGLTGAATVGGTAYGAGKFGYNKGSKETANKLTAAFTEANVRENQQIADSFRAFNKMENRGIAQAYFKRGLAMGSGMDKKASIQNIYEEAFKDEFKKQAFVSTFVKSFKTLGSGLKKAYGQTKAIHGKSKELSSLGARSKKRPGLERGISQRKSNRMQGLKDTAANSKAALGTIGGVGALGTGYALGSD